MSRHEFLPVYLLFFFLAALDRVSSTFSKNTQISDQYRSNKWLFTVPFYAYLFIVAVSVVEFLFLVRNVRLSVSVLGGLCFLCGSYLRRKSIADLGGSWSIYSEVKDGQKLVMGGIYRFFKHPYYLAVMFELIGACLVPNAFYSLFVVLLIQGPLLIVRISFEERLLISFFGDKYENYRKGKLV